MMRPILPALALMLAGLSVSEARAATDEALADASELDKDAGPTGLASADGLDDAASKKGKRSSKGSQAQAPAQGPAAENHAAENHAAQGQAAQSQAAQGRQGGQSGARQGGPAIRPGAPVGSRAPINRAVGGDPGARSAHAPAGPGGRAASSARTAGGGEHARPDNSSGGQSGGGQSGGGQSGGGQSGGGQSGGGQQRTGSSAGHQRTGSSAGHQQASADSGGSHARPGGGSSSQARGGSGQSPSNHVRPSGGGSGESSYHARPGGSSGGSQHARPGPTYRAPHVPHTPPRWVPAYHRYDLVGVPHWHPHYWATGVFIYSPPPRGERVVVVEGQGSERHRVKGQPKPTRALNRNGAFGVGITAGSYMSGYEGGGGYGDMGLGVNAEFRPVESVGLEVAWMHSSQTWDETSTRINEPIQTSVNLYAFPWTKVSPYITAGVTMNRRLIQDSYYDGFSYQEVSSTDSLFGPHGGLGIQFAMGKNAAVDFSADYIGYLDRRPEDLSLPAAVQGNMGLKFYF